MEHYNIILGDVINALITRGYNPYAQLKGYTLKKSPLYITSFNNARDLIQKVEIEYIQEYLKNWDKHQDNKWVIEFLNKVN